MAETREALERLLSERIAFLDGAMGTMIQGYGLEEQDFRGEVLADHPGSLKGNNDLLALTRPDVVREIHASFFRAGADIVETNTFGSNAIAQADYQMEAHVYEMAVRSAEIAKACAQRWTEKTPDKPRFVAGDAHSATRAVAPRARTSFWSQAPIGFCCYSVEDGRAIRNFQI